MVVGRGLWGPHPSPPLAAGLSSAAEALSGRGGPMQLQSSIQEKVRWKKTSITSRAYRTVILEPAINTLTVSGLCCVSQLLCSAR